MDKLQAQTKSRTAEVAEDSERRCSDPSNSGSVSNAWAGISSAEGTQKMVKVR